MIITKTPLRMSFFGGGTDFPEFFKEYGGAVLSTTFDKYCYVTVRHLPRFFEYTSELCYSEKKKIKFIDDIEHPLIREAMRMLDIREIRLIGATAGQHLVVHPGAFLRRVLPVQTGRDYRRKSCGKTFCDDLGFGCPASSSVARDLCGA